MKVKKFCFLLLVIPLVLSGCGLAGNDDDETTAAPPAASTTQTQPPAAASSQSTQSASTGAQTVSLASGGNSVLTNLGNAGSLSGLVGAPKLTSPIFKTKDPGLSLAGRLSEKMSSSGALRKAKEKASSLKKAGVTAAALVTNNCTKGGTYIINTATSEIMFKNCREDNSQFDGTIGISDMSSPPDIHFIETIGTSGSPFVMLEFKNDYATLMSRMESALTMQYIMPSSGSTITMTIDSGTISVFDYIGQTGYSMTFTNYSNAMTVSGSVMSLTTTGGFGETWTENGVQHSVAISFQNLALTITEGAGYTDVSISGSMTVDFTPDMCAEGTFTFATNTPIRYSSSTGLPTQGELLINSSVTVKYNSDGSITITDSSGSDSYDSEYELSQLCDFQTFDEEAPVSGGSTGGGTSTGSKMTITSSSSGADLNCYTDIHVNYYGTTSPTASTTGTWYVDWHQHDGCTNPSGIAFEQALDITNDGICDVGLDINGADYDIMSGGLEHFIATSVPTGYYVVSMNNFSCYGVSNKVTVQIGDSVFGPYNCTYSTSDGEGTTAGAWCAVADIRVNSNGTFDVLGHNPSLELWHTGNFGMMKPLNGQKRR